MRHDASTGEIFSTSSGAPTGSAPPRRSMPVCDSQLFALETRRAGASTPRARAYSPTANARSASHGSASGPSLAWPM